MECQYCAKSFEQGEKKNKFCSLTCANFYFQSKAKKIYKINESKFRILSEEHEKHIQFIKDKYKIREWGTRTADDAQFFEELKIKTKLICLINAGCRCERCSTEQGLTVHHIFTRRVKHFMPFDRYMSQRYYWRNIVVLCVDCHKEFHSSEADWDEELTPLNSKWIESIRKEYLI